MPVTNILTVGDAAYAWMLNQCHRGSGDVNSPGKRYRLMAANVFIFV